MEDATGRASWVDVEALLAADAHPPHSLLAEAAASLWRAVDLLEDADINTLRAEGEAALRRGDAELRQMVDLLLRRLADVVDRVGALLSDPPAPAGRP